MRFANHPELMLEVGLLDLTETDSEMTGNKADYEIEINDLKKKLRY